MTIFKYDLNTLVRTDHELKGFGGGGFRKDCPQVCGVENAAGTKRLRSERWD